MGNFTQMSLPLADSVDMTLQLVNSSETVTISVCIFHVQKHLGLTCCFVSKLPYRSRFGTTGFNFTDSKSFRANNCVATASTNGVALGENSASNGLPQRHPPGGPFAPAVITPDVSRKHPISVLMDAELQMDIVLPPSLTPTGPVSGTGVTEFFLLSDGKTGVLALGSFDEPNFDTFETTLLTGLQTLVSKGATQLVVDVVRVIGSAYSMKGITNSAYRRTTEEVRWFLSSGLQDVALTDVWTMQGFICIAHVSTVSLTETND